MSKSSSSFFDNAGKKIFILFEDLGSVQFFFVSGNDHMWPEIGVRALFIAYLVHMGPTNIFMVRGYHMVDFKSFMELVS